MKDEKPIVATLYHDGKKVADLESVQTLGLAVDINEIGFVDYSALDNGYILDTSRIGDEENPYITRARHEIKTHGKWATIARAQSFIAARAAHRIWLYALGSNDALIDAYVINQSEAERKDEWQ